MPANPSVREVTVRPDGVRCATRAGGPLVPLLGRVCTEVCKVRVEGQSWASPSCPVLGTQTNSFNQTGLLDYPWISFSKSHLCTSSRSQSRQSRTEAAAGRVQQPAGGQTQAGRGRCLTRGLIKDRSLPEFHQGWSSEERNAIKRPSL